MSIENEFFNSKFIQINSKLTVFEDKLNNIEDRIYSSIKANWLKGFTGIDDPYEEPQNPEISIDTSHIFQDEAVEKVLMYLENEGYIA